MTSADAPEEACDCQCGRMFVLPDQRAAAAKHANQTGHHLRGRTAAICAGCAAPAEYGCEDAPTTCAVHKSSCCRRLDGLPRAELTGGTLEAQYPSCPECGALWHLHWESGENMCGMTRDRLEEKWLR